MWRHIYAVAWFFFLSILKNEEAAGADTYWYFTGKKCLKVLRVLSCSLPMNNVSSIRMYVDIADEAFFFPLFLLFIPLHAW
jgi:hypothetical protein